jgi:hypothetical protein
MSKPDLSILPAGYGHWKITTTYYGKTITCITTDSMAVDDYNSVEGERNLYRQLRTKAGYEALRSECISKNKGV